MKKRIVALVAVVALGTAGYFAWRSFYGGGAAGDDTLGGSGTIESDQLAVTPQTAGRILSGPSEEGAPVKRGDVLFRLDRSVLDLQVKQAEAGVAVAKADYDNAVEDEGSKSPEAAAAKARYDQANVALAMARVQAGYATVTSPIDGTVTNIAAHAGENAVPGNTLAIVSDPASLTVTIYVPEGRIGEVTVGQKGTLTTDSTDKGYSAEVIFIASQAEFTPASIETKDQRVKLVYQVKLRITDADASLKAGMPADVTLR